VSDVYFYSVQSLNLLPFIQNHYLCVVEKWKQLNRHIKYLWRAKTKYQVHSPFVFEFINEVLEDDRFFYAFEELEWLREDLKESDAVIPKKDFGAGSKNENKKTTTVASIAKYNQSHPRTAQFLFRLTNRFKPKTMIELGTSLGITTMYQAFGATDGEMHSIEGCPATAIVARNIIHDFKARNVTIHTGIFDHVLPNILEQIKKLDYIFIDGNHRKEPTIEYFEMCLPYIHNNSIMVFHDIRWSESMADAWSEIKTHQRVTLTLEIYDFGVVFFRNEQLEKQHFSLLPTKYKPLSVFSSFFK
jgi:predicted O-methyltransferase YrrM